MKPRMFFLLGALAAAALLSGCATNGYQQFYIPAPAEQLAELAQNRATPARPGAEPVVERVPPPSGKPGEFARAYSKRGFEMIGFSEFTSGSRHGEPQAIEQAKAVGADLVAIVSPRYLGSHTASMPLTLPTSSTTYSSGSATAFGRGGAVTAFGSGQSTTYGSSTTYIPVTTHRHEYGAAFFVKTKVRIGLHFRPLDEAERKQLQTNQALVVDLVVDDSRAFYADILEGDVLLEVGGVKVAGLNGLRALMATQRDGVVNFTLLRDGKTIHKALNLGS